MLDTLAILTLILSIIGCRTQPKSDIKEIETPAAWSNFEQAWDRYIANLPKQYPYLIQERCHPILAKPLQPAKGVVLLFHGFTACPMQFNPFVEAMTALGYYVIVPLLPGQGRGPSPMTDSMKPMEDGKETTLSKYYGRYLPVEKEGYEVFVEQMNDIVAQAPGRHAVAGLSAGGALTTQAVLMAQEKGLGALYDAALPMSPYYGMPGLYLGRKPSENRLQSILNAIQQPIGDLIYHLQRGAASASESLSLVGEIPISFGKKCYESICGDRLPECRKRNPELQSTGGRDAICDFKLVNLEAMEQQGESIRRRFLTLADAGWIDTRFQIIGTEFDGSADAAHMISLGQAILQKRPEKGNFCLYKPYENLKVPHVLFDLSEQPFAPMPWRKSLLDQAYAFLDEGTFFASGPNPEYPVCAVK